MKNAIVFPASQPSWPPCVIAYTSADKPAVTDTAPIASNDLTRASRLSRNSSGASEKPITPTGTLTKKIHDQLSALVRTPPMRTPAAAPKPPTAPHTPSAMLRSRPSVKVVERIDSAAGVITAAPRPWNARAEMSDASDHARPAKSEASEKTTRPARKIRLRPSRSAARPPSNRKPPKTSAYALITHCRFSCEKPRSTWIDGNATFTIAMSRTTMNWTTLRSASASHLRRSVATMCRLVPFVFVGKACNLTDNACRVQVFPSQQQADLLHFRAMVKRYDAYCPVAHALAVVGEKWALLVVLELVDGPKRY